MISCVRITFVSLVASGLLVACAGNGAAADPPRLDDTAWVLSDLPGRTLADTKWDVTGYNNGRQAVVSVLNGTRLSIGFPADGKASGFAGCNRFSGTFESQGTSLSFGPVATTRMACASPDGIMEQEQAFLKALETVSIVRFEGDRLELRTRDGELAMTLGRSPGE